MIFIGYIIAIDLAIRRASNDEGSNDEIHPAQMVVLVLGFAKSQELGKKLFWLLGGLKKMILPYSTIVS